MVLFLLAVPALVVATKSAEGIKQPGWPFLLLFLFSASVSLVAAHRSGVLVKKERPRSAVALNLVSFAATMLSSICFGFFLTLCGIKQGWSAAATFVYCFVLFLISLAYIAAGQGELGISINEIANADLAKKRIRRARLSAALEELERRKSGTQNPILYRILLLRINRLDIGINKLTADIRATKDALAFRV